MNGRLQLEGKFDLAIRRPGESLIRLEQTNLITSIGKTALGSLATDQANYSPMTHLVFGSGTTVAAYLNTALVSEQWAIPCTDAGQRIVSVSEDLVGFSIQLLRPAAVTYSGSAFPLNEMGVVGRAGGKAPLLYSRALATSPVQIVNGTTMTASWTLRFTEVS